MRASAAAARRPVLWASPSVAARAGAMLGVLASDSASGVPRDCDLLIAVGGGTLLDRAKWAAKGEGRDVKLVAVPSLWGSGAEASKVVVLNDAGRKTIYVDDKLLPNARGVWPELAETIPERLAVEACGDAWSHAVEGFWSPLASEALRDELSALIGTMLALPLARDARWFEPSARACAGQARASVGLIHGIAHTLEHPLRVVQPHAGWGHAKLCSVFLWPVIRFNLATSEKPRLLAKKHGVDIERVSSVAKRLHDVGAYAAALPVLTEHWKSVLRDACTRTNSALVRPSALEYFQNGAFA